jgi:SAM-dependent methyltransferase
VTEEQTTPQSNAKRTPVRSAYDELASTYDSAYADEVCAAEDRAVERLLRPMVRAAGSVLDVGCGTGWVLDHCKDLLVGTHRNYRGFDLSPGMLEQLSAKHQFSKPRPAVWVGDLNARWVNDFGNVSLGLDNAHDLVVSTFASPSYATDVPHFLSECRRVLKPGGRIFLMPHARGAERRDPYMHVADAYIGDVPWAERRTLDLLTSMKFVDVEVTGLRHPEMGPGLHRGRLWHDSWMRVEQRLFRPDAMSFLCVKARLG